ncbi:uncharacterized protein LOC124258492 [Haliotis rubra]|uniref:uncharacterized protein LOC124258492 n=1 Tax=Haliotis rubra TaxID=36100 RepID=UPI001EE504F0|nr:uncharacterized protein LOC124258492 [Haliotis rubra]
MATPTKDNGVTEHSSTRITKPNTVGMNRPSWFEVVENLSQQLDKPRPKSKPRMDSETEEEYPEGCERHEREIEGQRSVPASTLEAMMRAMIDAQQKQTDRLMAKLGPRLGYEISDSQPGPSTSGLEQSKPDKQDDGESDVAGLVAELKSFFDDTDETSPNVRAELASTVSDGIRNVVNIKKIKAIMEKYKRPGNCEGLLVPQVNDEIWRQARTFAHTRDIQHQHTQALITKALIPVIQATDHLMAAALGETPVNVKELLVKSMDAIRLLSGAISEVNKKRREGFKPEVGAPYKRLCTEKVTTTKYLFGDDLPKKVKDISDSKQLGLKMTDKFTKKKYHGEKFNPYQHANNRFHYGQGHPSGGNRGTGGKKTFRGRIVSPYPTYGKGKGTVFLPKKEGERKYQ